jgi:circadian clock protein KaiC
MRMLSRDPLKFRRHMLSIRECFTNMGCTVLALDAGGLSTDELHSATLPHGVIRLEHVTSDFGARRRRLIVQKMRGTAFDDGYHDLKIEKGGITIYPRVVAANHQSEFIREAAPSGIEKLDSLCGGGLPRGTSTVFMGSAGTGKSTLAGQFVTAAAGRGERSAVFSFDETIGTMLDRSEGFGMPMRKFVKDGLVSIQQVDPGELSPGQFAHLVRLQVEERDARIVVIDSLNGYLQATPDERFLMVQLHELLTYLAGQGVVTILIVAQHGLLGSQMNTTIDVSYLADTVFLHRYFESEGAVRKCLSVLKKRIGTHESTIRELQLISGSVLIGPPLAGFHGVLTGVPTLASTKALKIEGDGDGGREAKSRS